MTITATGGVVSEAPAKLSARLDKALTELPAAYDQLLFFITPRSNAGLDGGRSNGIAAHQTVINVEVLDLLDDREKPYTDVYPVDDQVRRLGVLPTLSTWVRYVDQALLDSKVPFEPPYRFVACSRSCRFAKIADAMVQSDADCTGLRMDHWTKRTVATESSWLHGHLGFIKDQPWLSKITTAIGGLYDEITVIIGREGPIKIKCYDCGWPVTEVTAEKGSWFTCTGCGKAWSWLQLRNLAEQHKPSTLKECAERSSTSVSLLREYIADGKIKPLPMKRGTAKLYDPFAVMQVTTTERYRRSPRWKR